MSYNLVVVESPAKAKTIEKYLKDLGKFKVVASVGHVRDLPKSNKNAIDIEKGFVPKYEISADKKKVIADIKKLAEKADEIFLATDPDREGEAIAWHLAEAIKLKNPKRVAFNEITEEAVKEAMAHPRKIDMNLKEAQEARRVLDRLFGYDLSGLIWKKVRYGLSAGRVQSPALRILAEREREIRAFEPVTFWTIQASVKNSAGDEFILNCTEEFTKKDAVDHILKNAPKSDWTVKDVKETDAKRAPRAPFTTSTLQQTASSRLGFSPSQTMRVAQKLYEAGHITYMRTDSPTLSSQAMGQITGFVKKEFGEKLLTVRAFKTKSKNAQEAHEAVRPTHVSKEFAGSTIQEKKLYDLIRRRTIASQMKDAIIKRTRILVEVSDKETPDFSINGSRLIDQGWLLIDPAAKGEDVILPEISSGEKLDLIKIEEEEKQTTPPNRYSEAGLVKELEKRGIGRPSTYAAIIKTLVDRHYVERENRALIPTDTGLVVSKFLEDHFEKYISDSFTAEMEEDLDEIAVGDREYIKTLEDFYKPFTKDVAAKEDIEKLTNLGPADKKFKCPKCKAAMVLKLGRGGTFMSCEKFPECDGALTMDGKEIGNEEPIGKDPETGENIYLLEGRFGPYVQIGQKTKENPKPRRASVPKDKNLEEIKLEDALKYLSVPRVLGKHPDTGEDITAGIGRFGPFIVHEGDFRSLKEDDVYTIELDRALEILAEPKKTRRGRAAKKK